MAALGVLDSMKRQGFYVADHQAAIEYSIEINKQIASGVNHIAGRKFKHRRVKRGRK